MQSLAQLLNDGGHYTVNEDVTLHWDEAKCYLQLSSNWNNQRKPYLPRQYISTASVGSEELYTNEFNWTRKEEENIWKSRRIAIGLVSSCDMARRSIERAEHSLNIIGLHNIKKLLIFLWEKKKVKSCGAFTFHEMNIVEKSSPSPHATGRCCSRPHTHKVIYIYTCAHTHCVYICCCVCFQIASLLFTSQQPALLFLFSVAPDRAPDLWFINYAIKKERERNGIHPRSFPMQLYQTNSTQRRFKWVLIYTAALCRKSWNFILLFELLFSRRGEREREREKETGLLHSIGDGSLSLLSLDTISWVVERAIGGDDIMTGRKQASKIGLLKRKSNWEKPRHNTHTQQCSLLVIWNCRLWSLHHWIRLDTIHLSLSLSEDIDNKNRFFFFFRSAA